MASSGRLHAHLPQDDIEKKANLTELSQDAKKKFLIWFLISLCYELSVCPFFLNSNKVYFSSSLIAKTNIYCVANCISTPTYIIYIIRLHMCTCVRQFFVFHGLFYWLLSKANKILISIKIKAMRHKNAYIPPASIWQKLISLILEALLR